MSGFRRGRQTFFSQLAAVPYPVVDNTGTLNFIPPVPARLVSIVATLQTDSVGNSPRTVTATIWGRQEIWDPSLPPGPPTGLASTQAWTGTLLNTAAASQYLTVSAFPGADGTAASGIAVPAVVVAPWGLVQVGYTNLDADDQLSAIASWEPV